MSTDRLTEILNYLSAMSRDIGEFRAETKARFDSIETRMSDVETRMGNLETEMRAGFEGVRADIRHLARKVEIMNRDLLDLRAIQEGLEQRMEALESKQA
jgi:chromosome segregation ATPase